MKYELEPDNSNCTDETLLDDLRNVATHLGKPSVTRDEYEAHGRFSSATLRRRFGSWGTVLQKGGLNVLHRKDITDAELIADLKRVAGLLGIAVVSKDDYDQMGKFSTFTFKRRFASWPEALRIAELDHSPSWHPKIANDDLFSNLAAVWEAIGKQPKQSDLHPPNSRFSSDTYTRRFGSWRKALEAFVAVANDPTFDAITPIEESTSFVRPQTTPPKHTPRQPSWRLRFLVNRRDRFTCRACGRSPATHMGTVLHVDHIKPWSQGGETTFGNLQTLCDVCNLGKSDLSMNVEEDNLLPRCGGAD